jgi:fructokinase
MDDRPVCIFGEVLFDRFPDGDRVLGGAPFNVAWHLQAFAQTPRLISRIGDDRPGAEIREAMTTWNMDCSWLQIDSHHPTGAVQVSMEQGEPSYEILPDQAYDFIAADPGARASGCGLLYHGTLALRNPVSRETLAGLKRYHDGTLFMDVNLRSPWWSRERVLALLRDAHWVKLNEQELEQLLPDPPDLQARAERLQSSYDLDGVVVTRGHRGAMLLAHRGQIHEVKPVATENIVDTVGAGDAFSAILILGIVHAWPPRKTLERAQRFASAVIMRRGATVRDPEFYRPFARDWNLP